MKVVEITNKMRGPIQIPIKTRREVPGSGTRNFTTLIIPGVGSGNNVYPLEDELHISKYTEDFENRKMISVRFVSNKKHRGD